MYDAMVKMEGKFGLYRQIEQLACVPLCNGTEKFALYFQHLYESGTVPTNALPVAFNEYCHEQFGGSMASNGSHHRYRGGWNQGSLVLMVLYGLRMVSDAIGDLNEYRISSKDLRSIVLDHLCGAGDLGTNHVVSLCCMARKIADRTCLTEPVVSTNLCKRVSNG
jgi:hypothetical protein